MKSFFSFHFLFTALHFEVKNNLLAHTRWKSLTIPNEIILSANGQRAKNGMPIKTEIKINKLDKINGNKSHEEKKNQQQLCNRCEESECVCVSECWEKTSKPNN